MNLLFDLSFLLVLPFWLLLVFVPRWRVTRVLASPPWPALPAALLYTLLVIPEAVRVVPVVAQPQLAAVAALLGDPTGATIAWIHFLAFDVFVAAWIHGDASRRGHSWLWVGPLLLVTLLLGPAGLLLYTSGRFLRPGRAGAAGARGGSSGAA